MKPQFQLFDRREFLGVASRTAAIFGLTLSSAKAEAKESQNPFAFDVSPLEKTDPKLISHSKVARWKCPHEEPKRLAVGPDDQLYLCAGNYVSVLDHDGRLGLDIALTEPSRCVAVSKDGGIFVGVRDHVEVFDQKGQRLAVWASPDKKAWLTSLAVGEHDVFAADSGNRVVLRYDRAGKLLGRIGQKNTVRNVAGFIVPSPYLDVVIHADGLLRVSNLGRHRVEVFTFEGDFEGAWGKPSGSIDGFCGCCNPIAIATLPDGRILTCEKGLPRVKIHSASGEFQSVVAGVEAFAENAKACSDLNDCTRGGMDAAVDPQGRIYILDFVTRDVRVMQRKT